MIKSLWPQEEMRTRIERKKFIMLTDPREGALCSHRGKHQRHSGDRKERGNSLGQSLCWGFCSKDKAGQGKQDNSGGLWAIGMVSSCPVPDPGMI